MKDNIDIFDEEMWKNIYPKAIHFALLLVKSRGLSKDFSNEVVQEAISRVLTEKRKWNSTEIDLLPFLKGVIKSIVSHHFEKAFYSKQKNSVVEIDGEFRDIIDSVECSNATAQEYLERKDMEKFLMEASGDDDEMNLVLICIFENKKRSEITDDLGIPINKVDNILKRIRRLTMNYFELNKI